MGLLKRYGLLPSGRNFRRLGLGTMCWSVALASAFGDSWLGSFLLGAFLLGLGCGLGSWEMGEGVNA